MTNRYPLIANSSTNQIQELASGDNLDLSSSGIVNAVSIGATNINVTGVVTASSFVGSFTGTASTASFATTSFGLSGSPNITVGTVTGNLTGNATGLSGTPNITVGVATVTTLRVGTGVTISSGVVTATTFVGALTGNATGLSGSPNITVGNITGTAATFTNLTVNGTQTIINTTSLEVTDKNIGIGSTSSPTDALADGAGITIYGTTNKTLTWDNSNSRMLFNSPVSAAGSITELYAGQYWNLVSQADVGIGASQVPLNQYLGQLAFVDDFSPTTLIAPRIQSVGEKTSIISGNTASLTYNTGGGNIAICTNPSGDITLAVAGIPTDSTFDNTSLTFSVFVNQTGTARSCTAVTLNGLSASIRWAGGSLSAAISGVTTTSGTDIFSFTGINTIGSAGTTANYRVLGVVNGGFR
jgi:hypothetical protein